MATIKEIAREKLNIPQENKIILSFDGGGVRGIFTLQLLIKLEEIVGSPIYEWVDMVAGTSTGAIIAGLIAKQKKAIEIEDIYKKIVSRVFTKKSFFSNRLYNPPEFDKQNYRSSVKFFINDTTLKEANEKSGLDLFFTSKDLVAGEETFFTCFNNNNPVRSSKDTYQNVLLRGVLEATMSAPTYFIPFERFVDGGTTTYNNPVLSAVVEALYYGGKGKYSADQTTIFSFGTASLFRFIPLTDVHNPPKLDSLFWLSYVMDESSKDASEMQVSFLRSKLIADLDFRRFQLSLDEDAIKKLPNKSIAHIDNLEADLLHNLKNDVLSKIDLSAVNKCPLLKVLGEAVTEYICPPSEESMEMSNRKGNWFRRDLVNSDNRRGELITAHGDKESILQNLCSPSWIDSQPTG